MLSITHSTYSAHITGFSPMHSPSRTTSILSPPIPPPPPLLSPASRVSSSPAVALLAPAAFHGSSDKRLRRTSALMLTRASRGVPGMPLVCAQLGADIQYTCLVQCKAQGFRTVMDWVCLRMQGVDMREGAVTLRCCCETHVALPPPASHTRATACLPACIAGRLPCLPSFAPPLPPASCPLSAALRLPPPHLHIC